MPAAPVGKDGKLNAHIYPLSFQKPTNTLVKGFLKGQKDDERRREDNSNTTGS